MIFFFAIHLPLCAWVFVIYGVIFGGLWFYRFSKDRQAVEQAQAASQAPPSVMQPPTQTIRSSGQGFASGGTMDSWEGRVPKQPELPSNIVSRLERFGQYEFNSQAYAFDGAEMGELVGELYAFASSDPERFLLALAQAVLPVGGWAVYGASCILWECFSSDAGVLAQRPAYKAIRDGAINFLRSNGVPPMRVKGYEWQYWTDNGGTSETWIQRRPIPTLAEAPITELQPGETRRVTQLTSERDSSAILIRRNSDGRYCALIDNKWSDEDPRRVQREWKFAETLYELYIQIGLAMQVPTYWYDRELEPYFPLPQPRI